MPGDGVSLSTTLAQMGTVAKTQAKGQQNAPQVTPFSEQSQEQEELKVQRVKETAESEKNRIAGEDQKKDRRKRRRLNRQNKKLAGSSAAADSGEAAGSVPDEEDGDGLGSLIDLRV